MSSETGKPFRAYRMAGVSRVDIGNVPNLLCNSNQPSTAPGTETGKGPNLGICVSPFSVNTSAVSCRGERPDAFSPYSLFSSAYQTIAKRSPPTPEPVGSTRPNMALAAMAASMALPPCFKMSNATWVASGWLVATIPFCAITSDRLAKGFPVILS